MHEYLKRLYLAMRTGAIGPGDVGCAEVQHDNSCAIYKDRECNCDPLISIRTQRAQIIINEDGSVSRVTEH